MTSICARWLLGVAGAIRVYRSARSRFTKAWRHAATSTTASRSANSPTADRVLLRVAHDGARPRDRDRDHRHRRTPDRRPRRPADHVEISDAHGVRTLTTPTFYERFADAFLREAMHFVECVRHDRPPPLTCTMRPRPRASALRCGYRWRSGGSWIYEQGTAQNDGSSRFLPRAGARRGQARAPCLWNVGHDDEGPTRRRHGDGPRGRAVHPRGDCGAFPHDAIIGEEEAVAPATICG